MSEFSTVSAPKPKFPPAALLSGFLKKALENTGRRVEEGGNPPVNMAMKALGLEGAASGLEKIGYEGMSGAIGPNGALINTTSGQPLMNQRSVETLGAVAPLAKAAGTASKAMAAAPKGQLNAILLPEEAFSFSTVPGKVKVEVGGRSYRNVPEGENPAFASIDRPMKAVELYPNLEGTKIANTLIVPENMPDGALGSFDPSRKIASFNPRRLTRTADVKSTLDHELTHAGQSAYNEPWLGSSPGSARVSPYSQVNVEALRNLSQVHNLDPEIKRRIMSAWSKSDFVDQHNLYERDPGEVLARVASMIPTGPAQRYFHNPETMQGLVRVQSQFRGPKFEDGILQQEEVPALLKGLLGYHPSFHKQPEPPAFLLDQADFLRLPLPTDLFAKGLIRKLGEDFEFRTATGSYIVPDDPAKLMRAPPLK